MSRFGVSGGALLFTATMACSGEGKSNHAGAAGAGGAPESGAGSGISDAGSAGHTLAIGGSSGGAGGHVGAGAAGASSNGGATAGSAGAAAASGAGNSAGGAAGSATGGAGGTGGACPAQPSTFKYDCAEVESKWKPLWDDAKGEIQFDVSSLPLPIKSGTLYFFYQETGVGCALLLAHGNGTMAVVPVGVPFAPSALRVAEFHLVDACGNHHDYDPGTPAACSDLRATGKGGLWPLTCSTRQDATCPEMCK